MSKKNTTIMIVVMAVVAVLFLLSVIPGDLFSVSKSNGSGTSYLEHADPASGRIELDPFKNVEIQVKAADLQIEHGDSYAVEYHLFSKEPVKRVEIKDEALFFETGMKFGVKADHDDYYVKLIIPEDADLDKIMLKTISGDISLSDLSFYAAYLENTSGEIEVSDITCDDFEVISISGDVELEDSKIQDVALKTTSGDIDLDGNYTMFSIRSTAGTCEFEGVITEDSTIDTVSGNIEVETSVSSIKANARSGITFNQKEQGKTLDLSEGDYTLGLKSVSGKIEINQHD